jgi:hypothetical protein
VDKSAEEKEVDLLKDQDKPWPSLKKEVKELLELEAATLIKSNISRKKRHSDLHKPD